jgi:hypothetical protein
MPKYWNVIERAVVVLLLLGVSACATTQIEATWSNPEFANRPRGGRVLVVGVTRDDTARRLYEDAMAAQLRSRGVDAIRSYDSVASPLADGGGTALIDAAKRNNATGILSSALVAREHVQRVRVDPAPPWGWDYYGWYGYYWPYGYARVETDDFDRYYVSTTLTDVSSGKIFWSARTRSDTPGKIEKEIKDFVSVISDALLRSGLM